MGHRFIARLRDGGSHKIQDGEPQADTALGSPFVRFWFTLEFRPIDLVDKCQIDLILTWIAYTRLPEKDALPNAPSCTEPEISSPLTLAVNSNFIGIGWTI